MTIMAAILSAPLFFYVGRRLSTAITNRFKISKKITLSFVFAVILWYYLYPITIMVFHLNGSIRSLFVFKPGLHWPDYLLLYPFWWGFICLLETVSFFALLDIFTLISRLKIVPYPVKTKWRNTQEFLKIGLVLFFLVYVGARIYIDTNQVRINTHNITIQNLPEEFQNLHIGFFGDIHADRYTKNKKLEKLEKFVHSGKEDLLLFSGDLISNGKSYVKQTLKIIGGPKAGTASIACMGDHDFWTDSRGIPGQMEAHGWTFLQDEHRLLPYKGKKILVTGITHIYSKRISKHELKKLLSRAPAAGLKILLVHQPREMLVEAAAEYGYHLLLGGHTHGGQIVPHLFGIPLNVNREETPFVNGRYLYNGLHVVITNGIGLTLAPVRYHAPAEITRIVLERN